jgi:hypothetical protein
MAGYSVRANEDVLPDFWDGWRRSVIVVFLALSFPLLVFGGVDMCSAVVA